MASIPTTTMPVNLSQYPKLTREQAGHLRHFHNLSSAPDGDWPHMGSEEPAQEFRDAYRYQLATMAYASALTHYHRLPAMMSLFKSLLHRLITKMLRREVWGYWYLTSQSEVKLDPDLKELRKPWADPVARENIMYSGHLLLMTSLYAMLFGDGEFERAGSLSFYWNPLCWGMNEEEERFEYDNRSLQTAIVHDMERNGWVGVCCVPNLVFVVCNQFPIIAMRLNDVRDGTSVGKAVLEKYKDALEKRDMVSGDDLYKEWFVLKQRQTRPAAGIALTAWSAAFMNTWNSETVRAGFDVHVKGFVTNINGEVELHHPMIAFAYREAMAKADVAQDSAQILQAAREYYKEHRTDIDFPYCERMFGYVVKWLAELGKSTELDGLLAYADTNLQPTWENGGLYYPRNNNATDDEGRWTYMDPFTGNAAIGYARLNVEDGMKNIYDDPWTGETLQSRPYVDGLYLSDGVDCLRGLWDPEQGAVIVTLCEWAGLGTDISFSVENLPAGTWSVYTSQAGRTKYELAKGGRIVVDATVGPKEEVDFVVLLDKEVALNRPDQDMFDT